MIALLLALAAAADGGTETLVVDRIAAVVNKNVVLQSEVDSLLDQMMQADPLPPNADVDKAKAARREDILDGLIAEKLLDDEVKKLRIDVTDAEVDRVVEATKKEHDLDDAKLKMALARQGLTLEEYKEGLKKQLTKMKIIQLKVKNRVQVTDQDVKAKIAQTALMSSMEFKVKARHILVLVPQGSDGKAELARILAAKERIAKGEKFEDVAKGVSEDPGSKDKGGDLGTFGRGEMVPEFERVAFTAEPGKVVGPVKTAFGYHLIKVEQHVATAQKTGPALEEDIRSSLFQNEIENQFRAYLDELKRDAHIEKRL